MSMFSLAVFWSRSSMLECGIATGRRVCPSVLSLSHAGNASKLITVGSRGFRRRVVKGTLVFIP